jgi:hypothetical protein
MQKKYIFEAPRNRCAHDARSIANFHIQGMLDSSLRCDDTRRYPNAGLSRFFCHFM